MTSEEIKQIPVLNLDNASQFGVGIQACMFLKEIAYQLAVMNENKYVSVIMPDGDPRGG